MISLFPIFLIAPGLLAQISIYNSIYQACGTIRSSQYGCGPNLVCELKSLDDPQCLAGPALKDALDQTCKRGKKCPEGSYCRKREDKESVCALCRSEFTSCAPTGEKKVGCCPGTKCTTVSAYVQGTIEPIQVCLSKNTLQKRAVSGFCYGRCLVSFCPFGLGTCSRLSVSSSGAGEDRPPSFIRI
jgi:hypothetical protein